MNDDVFIEILNNEIEHQYMLMRKLAEKVEDVEHLINKLKYAIDKMMSYEDVEYSLIYWESFSKELSHNSTKSEFITSCQAILILVFYHLKIRKEGITESIIRKIFDIKTNSTRHIGNIDFRLELQEDKSKKMTEIALKKGEQERLKKENAKKIIREVWHGHNWKTYTECADHLYENKLTEVRKHRALCSLVSEIAKEKREKK